MTDGRAAGLYALALLPAVALALAAGGFAMDLAKRGVPGRPSGAAGWALNVLPALAAGLLVYLPLARFVQGRCEGASPLGGHVRRCAALYLVAVGLGAPLLHDAGRPEFWSFGQLALWSWLVPVAGIAADAVAAARRSAS